MYFHFYFLFLSSLQAERRKQKEERRREKEAARQKAAMERATARKIAKESMELIEDERLELMELAASSKGLPTILSLDYHTLQNLEAFRGWCSLKHEMNNDCSSIALCFRIPYFLLYMFQIKIKIFLFSIFTAFRMCSF